MEVVEKGDYISIATLSWGGGGGEREKWIASKQTYIT